MREGDERGEDRRQAQAQLDVPDPLQPPTASLITVSVSASQNSRPKTPSSTVT